MKLKRERERECVCVCVCVHERATRNETTVIDLGRVGYRDGEITGSLGIKY